MGDVAYVLVMTAVGHQAGLTPHQITKAINTGISVEDFSKLHGVTEIDPRSSKALHILNDMLKKRGFE